MIDPTDQTAAATRVTEIPPGSGHWLTRELLENVEVTYTFQQWQIRCSWPEKRKSDIYTKMKIRDLSSGALVLSDSNVNLYTSTRNVAVTAIQNHAPVSSGDGGKALISQLIHNISDDLITEYRQAGDVTMAVAKRRTGDSHLLYPLWPSTGGTLVAAATNSYKSWIAAAVAVEASTGADILGGNTRPPQTPIPVLYLDWESDLPSFGDRLNGISRGYGLPEDTAIPYKHLDVPLADVVESLRDKIILHGYRGVIVDSLSAAVGGSLVDDELANKFWNAVSRLGVPALVLAHKSAEAIRKGHQRVFGSVMHENRSRMLWDAYRDTDSPRVKWEIVSDNNTGRTGDKLAWQVDITNEGEYPERHLDTVNFTAVNPDNVNQAPAGQGTLADDIARILTDTGPLTSGELARSIGTTDGTIRKQLSRHGNRFLKLPDSRWKLASRSAT